MEPWAPSRRFRLVGAGVHLYTASGTVLAFLVVAAALDGNTTRALWIGLAALIIDGSDGMLARRMRVKETLPQIDGARLDDIVDYITYVFAPVVLLWTGGYLPAGHWGEALAALPLLASSYQFCRVDAKTDDHYFLGFPSYWNVIAFYAVVMDLSASTLTVILIVCSVLVFVPVKYIYPSRTLVLRRTNLLLAVGWLVTYGALLLQMPQVSGLLLGVSLGYVAYYAAASVYLTLKGRGATSPAPAGQDLAGRAD